MELWMLVIIVAAAVILVIAATSFWMSRHKQQRTERLQTQFGSEYDRTVDASGRKAAEADLTQRQERVSKLELRSLSENEKRGFADRWQRTQADFVDDPGGAVTEADALVSEVMQARGYPMGDFEQRATDVSVDHAEVVSNYRAAHAIALSHARASASTEDLRQAMVHYRSLFTDLLQTASGAPESDSRASQEPARTGR
jgi:hypothetical protein